MRGAILDSARLVARSRISRPVVTAPTLDVDGFRLMSWQDLVAEGAVARRRITSGEVAAALRTAGAADAALDVSLGKPDDLYIEVLTGLLTPAAVGGNLLGLRNFEEYRGRMPRGAPAIFVASNGPYDFLGTRHYRQSEGFRFDRIRVVQGEQTFSFANDNYQRLGTGAADGIRAQQYAGLFALPANAKFDPLQPWRLELLVNGAGASPVSVSFPVEFRLPAAFILMPDQPPVAAWVEAWRDARGNIAILAALLAALTLIFAFQAQLSRSRRAHRLVRNGFLLVVLVWLGWTVGVQLSIVNVINYIEAPFRGVDIGFYLAEPLMVMIALYTLVSVVLIGRGVFCGWLCPFGALQELLAQLARAAGLPQWNPSQALEQRLWLGKYIAAAVVLALVLTCDRRLRRDHRDRALQDRDHLQIHPRLALCALCRRAARHRAILRAGLLPLPVPARRRARRARPAASDRPAQAPAGMRKPVPAVRTLVPGAGDRDVRQDHHRGMFSVPGLPSRVL